MLRYLFNNTTVIQIFTTQIVQKAKVELLKQTLFATSGHRKLQSTLYIKRLRQLKPKLNNFDV